MRSGSIGFAGIALLAAGADPSLPTSAVITYDDIPGHFSSAPVTAMTAAGRAIHIGRYKSLSYARFATVGAVPVVVTAGDEIASCTVRPSAYAIKPASRGRTCTFSVAGPKQLEVSINSLEKLFLFVEAPEREAPSCCDGSAVFDVTRYPNVDPTGATKSTGIQGAIDDVAGRSTCTSTSPCSLYFPSGTYLARQLFLRSKVKLYLEGGAKLKASTNPADYQLDKGTHRTAFLVADQVSYTGVYGRGAIDGDGLAYRKRNNAGSAYPYGNCRSTTRFMCWDSPQLLLIRRSHHVTVRDVMMLDPAAWTNHVHYSDRVTYDNVKVLDDRIKFNTDAMDVDASTNVTVTNSFYHGKDDGFCVKATKELGLIKPSTNIQFLNNTVGYGNNAAKLGTETYVGGNMDGITVQNLYVTNHWGRSFGVYVKDGNSVGPASGITVDGVFADTGGAQGFAIEITKRKSTSAVGLVNHVYLRNFNLPSTTGTSTIKGYDSSHKVSNVSIADYRIGGAVRKTLSDARIARNGYTSGITIQ